LVRNSLGYETSWTYVLPADKAEIVIPEARHMAQVLVMSGGGVGLFPGGFVCATVLTCRMGHVDFEGIKSTGIVQHVHSMAEPRGMSCGVVVNGIGAGPR